jgi:hypothetical protein
MENDKCEMENQFAIYHLSFSICHLKSGGKAPFLTCELLTDELFLFSEWQSKK